MPHALPEVLRALPSWDSPSGGEGLAPDESEADRRVAFEALQSRVGYAFARPELLRVALTLGSWANENRAHGWPGNGCLEFLGDAVLDLVAAHSLWLRFPEQGEGTLTRLRASLVSTASLAPAATRLGLGACLWVGRGDEPAARSRPSTLADTFEAVLGALYLDAQVAGADPLSAARGVFESCFAERLAEMGAADGQDPKSRLQRQAQARFRATPAYELEGETPAAHEKDWRVVVRLPAGEGEAEGRVLGRGRGESRKLAEREAARDALARLSAADEDPTR